MPEIDDERSFDRSNRWFVFGASANFVVARRQHGIEA